jgi:phenylalanyl-tRNA synthetase alpha chain
VTALLKSLGALDPEERREAGLGINGPSSITGGARGAARMLLEAGCGHALLPRARIDVTLPGRGETGRPASR